MENEFLAIPFVLGMDEVETAIGFLLLGSDLVPGPIILIALSILRG
ncbi:MAG: hypothetical protein ACOC23_08885 [Thermodesulfobacteriota bacterium]